MALWARAERLSNSPGDIRATTRSTPDVRWTRRLIGAAGEWSTRCGYAIADSEQALARFRELTRAHV
jgi:hypothetical protein